MFATKCSFCQFDNVPGARFCAECGSPLHLKVCPGCGKVSDVTAQTCEHCRAPFPRIELAPVQSAAQPAPAPAPQQASPPTAAPVRQTAIPQAPSPNEVAPAAGMRAWPLIMVALVAGGLPLLWFNRASLPEPKTFTPPPVGAPTISLPPSAPAVQPPVQQPSGSSASSQVAAPATQPVPTAQAGPPSDTPVSAGQPGATATLAPAQRTPPKAKAPERVLRPSPAPAKKVEPQVRECTEAVAAVGLCDPKKPAR